MKTKNYGGRRENAGRKSKAEELGLPMLMSEVITEADWLQIFRKIAASAKKGSFDHQKLLLEYKFGKPRQTVDQQITHQQIVGIDEIEIVYTANNRTNG